MEISSVWQESHSRVERCIADLRQGRPVLIHDAENRENEVDLIAAGQYATAELVNTALTDARGLLCVGIDPAIADRIGLPVMQTQWRSRFDTAFTLSVDIREGTTTGISAQDRSRTIQALANPRSTAKDFIMPGHVFPVRAKEDGVLVRSGHTEGGVDLTRLAGLTPVTLMCEVLDLDGTSLRGFRVEEVAREHGWNLVSIQDIIDYRLRTEIVVTNEASAHLPTAFGDFETMVYTMPGQQPVVALVLRGERVHWTQDVTVRIHSECFTGDVLGSLRCDCGGQLMASLDMIRERGEGVLLYLPQEGRGIGIAEKIRAYALQEQGMDTVDANLHLGHSIDAREYGFAAQILRHLGLRSVRLLTNNPAKIQALERYGVHVSDREPLEIEASDTNRRYLETKRDRLGHLLNLALEGMKR